VLVLCVSWQLGNGAVPTAGVMAPHGGLSQPPQIVMEGTSHSSSNATDVDIPPEAQPPAPAATLVEDMDMNECSAHDRNRDLTGRCSFLTGIMCFQLFQWFPTSCSVVNFVLTGLPDVGSVFLGLYDPPFKLINLNTVLFISGLHHHHLACAVQLLPSYSGVNVSAQYQFVKMLQKL